MWYGEGKIHSRALGGEVGVVSIHEVIPSDLDVIFGINSSAIITRAQSVQDIETVDRSVRAGWETSDELDCA